MGRMNGSPERSKGKRSLRRNDYLRKWVVHFFLNLEDFFIFMRWYHIVRLYAVVVAINLGMLADPCETFAAATITVINRDGQNEGFNDPTPFTPIGGNTATTLGEARLKAFEYAATIWEGLLTSSVEIRVDAAMDPLGSGILGQAGPTTVHRNFTNTPAANTWYVQALANKLAEMDLDPLTSDMSATFSSDFTFYFGLDGNPPSSQYDFVSVVLHELAHGLGFLSLVDLSTGAKFSGMDDAYSRHLEQHDSIPADYPTMTDSQRVMASVSGSNLHFTGPEVVSSSGILTAGKDSVSGHVEMYAPGTPLFGSSVSHFNKVMKPDQLMEHSISSGEAIHTVGIAGKVLADLGWDVNSVPMITRPISNSTLTDSTVTFEWTAHDQTVTTWWLYIGSDVGGRDIYDSGDLGMTASQLITGLPTDGRMLYVRLWYRIGEFWEFSDEQYTAANLVTLMSEGPTSATLGSSSTTFQWPVHNQSVTKWWLYIGSDVGARDIYNSGDLGMTTSQLVTGLPTDGRPLYIRLWYQIEGVWEFTDEQYSAANLVALTVTRPISTILVSSSTIFEWTTHDQSVTKWWLYIGSDIGARDIYNSGDLGMTTSQLVTGLPTDGRTLYVRFWYLSHGIWQLEDFQYTASSS